MRSISIKLWGLMLALVFIALAVIWCFQIVFLESFYFNIHEKKLLKEGKLLAAMLESNADQFTIERKLDELLLKYNARIDIYTGAGVVIYSSEAAPKTMGIDKGAFLMEVLKSKKAISTFEQNRMGSSILFVGLPVTNNNIITAAVIMTVPVASLKETVDTLKEQFIMISFILISVSAILSYAFSRYFTKPILEINKAAKTMAEGNLSIKVPISTRDELGMLSGTINHLSMQLQKIEQLRKELIANVSHEFKTPLSLIKGYAETMRDVANLSEEKKNKQLNIVIEEADKLNNMINEILDLSQMQSDYKQLEVRDFLIGEPIASVINRLQYHMEDRKVGLLLECHPGLIVMGDEKRIEQVIYNLLNNAINHSEEGRSIWLRVLDKEDNVLIEIEDQGAGIAKEELPYIWDRFYKGKGTARNRGSGLGLAIVKSIIEAHKTSFGVDSQLGKGSKFWFVLKKGARNSAI